MATSRRSHASAGAGLGPRLALARVITAAAAIVAGIIVAAVVLKLLKANASNQIVHAVERAGSWLSSPFHGLFTVHGDWRLILNWGLAALVYLIVGRLLARLIAR